MLIFYHMSKGFISKIPLWQWTLTLTLVKIEETGETGVHIRKDGGINIRGKCSGNLRQCLVTALQNKNTKKMQTKTPLVGSNWQQPEKIYLAANRNDQHLPGKNRKKHKKLWQTCKNNTGALTSGKETKASTLTWLLVKKNKRIRKVWKTKNSCSSSVWSCLPSTLQKKT